MGGSRGGGEGDHGSETGLIESLKKQLQYLKQDISRHSEVVETLKEKLLNCISRHGDFDSGASDGVTNIVNMCNKLKMKIEKNL